jgi:putative pre-16S rRNA nuclease
MNINARARAAGESAAAEAKSRRVLAVDYGRKKIGLALSDDLGLSARPLAILVRANRQLDLRRLREICREYAVKCVIVGNPLHIAGEAGEMAHEAARFAQRLKKHLGIPVELVDERLTTWEARQTMRASNSSRKKKRSLDDIAAAILLRDYMQTQRSLADGPGGRD